MDSGQLSRHSEFLIKAFEGEKSKNHESGITVNPVAAELAAWYEKLRTAIENRDEEVILRAAIERILRRRLILGGNGKTVAAPFVRELIWARYFPDGSIEEKQIEEAQNTIDIYLELKRRVVEKHSVPEGILNEWIYQLMSCELEDRLSPSPKKEAMISYIFHILKGMVEIKDDTQEVRDVQVYVAIRKTYAKEDLALLRYHLFKQYFGRLASDTLKETTERFKEGKYAIDEQLNYPGRFKIFQYIKRQIPPFLILEDIVKNHQGKFRDLIVNAEELSQVIEKACKSRYANISAKVRRAIVRSIIFILLSKVFIAFAIEGTYENLVYGKIMWVTLGLNIAIPVALMVILSFFVKAPGHDNTERIIARINSLLFDATPQLGRSLSFSNKPKTRTLLDTIFSIIWIGTFALSFGIIIYILTRLGFNIVSQGVFLFFFALIVFLSYRINQTANIYIVKDKSTIVTPFVDFFFMPIARVGRYLAEGIQQINILIFILDLIIETPFKGMIAFFEQWFVFLHSKREELA